MKKGLIVYIAGEEPDNSEIETRIIKEELDADRVEVVSSRSGNFDIHNAAWRLTAAGMQNIVCVTAVYTETADLKLTGRSMRLCG